MVVGEPGEPIGNCSDHTDRLKLPPGATSVLSAWATDAVASWAISRDTARVTVDRKSLRFLGIVVLRDEQGVSGFRTRHPPVGPSATIRTACSYRPYTVNTDSCMWITFR